MNQLASIMASTGALPRLEELALLMPAYSEPATTLTPLINARNDAEAIQTWLNEYTQSEATLRSYRKEAERFLLWCTLTLQKTFATLTREDFDRYAAFLDNPEPKSIWCGTKGGRGNKRGSSTWRPFTGSLSHSAKVTALTIIQSLFNYLVEARYLPANPLGLMRKIKQANSFELRKLNVHERILTDDEWQAILDTLHAMPYTTDREKQEMERLHFIIAMLFFLGLRVGELASHTWQAFKKIDERWWFFVVGKGGKLGKVPVNDYLLDAVIRYRVFFNKTVFPNEADNTPLAISFTSSQESLSTRHVSHLLKNLALEAAKRFPDSIAKQKKLAKFSPHWLRHLSASMQDRVGVPFTHIRENHRHAKDDTTRIYVHGDDNERHKNLQNLAWHKEQGALNDQHR